jgi:hypothetical protein
MQCPCHPHASSWLWSTSVTIDRTPIPQQASAIFDLIADKLAAWQGLRPDEGTRFLFWHVIDRALQHCLATLCSGHDLTCDINEELDLDQAHFAAMRSKHVALQETFARANSSIK